MASAMASEIMPAGEDLTDDQIEELLQRAEARLRGEQSTLSLVPNASTAPLSTPRKTSTVSMPAPAVRTKHSIARADPSTLVSAEDQRLANQGIRKVEDPVKTKRQQVKDQKATAGNSWFNLPRTNMTPQLKRDLQILRMRNVLDPHRHYKKDGNKALVPEYSQVGTIVEGPTEFFSARVPRRERHQTLSGGVMEDERGSKRMKRKYEELQERKKSGKKGHYRKMMEKRYKGKIDR
ncbi:MAG: hypothetical protein Q9162_006274 [Coniocarpon cinnabarinum]